VIKTPIGFNDISFNTSVWGSDDDIYDQIISGHLKVLET
jgi:hypothetical protein